MKRPKTILALGADIKNRFLVARGKKLSFGPDIGDLGDAKNYELFKKEVEKAIKGNLPDIIACDLRPSYFSVRFANQIVHKLSAISYKPVQHHHAHIASVMQEHNLKKPVIGVSFDGTGFGTDGNIWGGEFLTVSKSGFDRVAHLRYYMMPGGEKVISEPWRMVLSILGKEGVSLVKGPDRGDKDILLSMMSKKLNSPLTSSAGRLFDAAAAILGICEYASYEAQGPIELEKMCEDKTKDGYEFTMISDADKYIIDTYPVFLGLVSDLKRKKNKRTIATKFHNSMCNIITKTVVTLSNKLGIKDIALSGGVFQNKFLIKKIIRELTSLRRNVFVNTKTPINDLNISLGQYWITSFLHR